MQNIVALKSYTPGYQSKAEAKAYLSVGEDMDQWFVVNKQARV